MATAAVSPRSVKTGKSDLPAQRRSYRWLVPTIVAVVVAVVSRGVIGFDWVYFDDDINVLLNPHLGRGAWSSVAWAFSQLDYIRRYVPLGWLGFDGVLQIDGYNPTVFHAASWLLQVANAVLAYQVFVRWVQPRVPTSGADPTWRTLTIAAIGALAWSLHPQRVENVGWISGLFYLGATALALAAVILDFDERAAEANGTHTWRRFAAPLLFTASLLYYPVFLAVPAVLLWRDMCEAGTRWRLAAGDALKRYAWWWVAAALVAAVSLYAERTAVGAFAEQAGSGFSIAEMPAALGAAVGHLVARSVWPGAAAPYYGHLNELLGGPAQFVPLAVAIGAALVALSVRRSRGAAAAWLIAGLLTLAPFLATIDRAFHPSDRYTVLWLFVWIAGAATWATKPRSRQADGVIAAVAIVIVAVWAVRFRADLGIWRNTATLQAAIDRATLDHPDPKMNYSRPALAFWSSGHGDEAARRIREGFDRFPNSLSIQEAFSMLTTLDERARTRSGVSVSPEAIAHVDLGRAAEAQGERDAAAAHYRRAIVLAPTYAEAVNAYRELNGDRRAVAPTTR